MLASISYKPVQRIGPLSPHGVGTAAGFFLGAMVMGRRAERKGIPRQEVYNACTWAAPGAIVGARLFYVLAHRSDFESLADVLAVWRGGLTMFGGFVGGLGLGILYMRRHGLPVPRMLDAAAPGFVVGVMVGRIGDLVIADHLGGATRFFLGYRIPEGADLAPGYGPPTYVPGAVVHQTALYDLLGLVVLAGVLALLGRRRLAEGALFAGFAIWYGLQRFLIDFTRNRELIESNFFGLSGSQWAGLAFAAAGAAWLLRLLGPRARPAAQIAPSPPAAAIPAVADTQADIQRWDDESPNPSG